MLLQNNTIVLKIFYKRKILPNSDKMLPTAKCFYLGIWVIK